MDGARTALLVDLDGHSVEPLLIGRSRNQVVALVLSLSRHPPILHLMKGRLLRFLTGILVVGALLFVGGTTARAQDSMPVPAVPAEELPAGSQVMTAGPVHEAFAKPVSMSPEEPIQVPQQPPANLQEVPPAERPAGAGIVWVPGYWAWDADRNDFIWVSGCWRNAPPNTYWVPGHWLQAGNGWEWIGGFWQPITAGPQQELEYLPAPPAPIEVEQPGPPPLPDQVWVPGCWYWSQGHYVRRSGYWITQQVGWVWVPSHFAWTPRGHIFIQGHWDHDMDNRGVLFCPTFFPHDVRLRAGFVFSPSLCVDLGMLRLNLFVYPRYRHYYFGDYYDDVYSRRGIVPWFRCQTSHTWYDPLFVYDSWHFRKTDPHWGANLERGYDQRRVSHDLRPARTYAALQYQSSHLPANRRAERPLVESVRSFAASQHTPMKFERINQSERQQIAGKAADVHQLREQRSQWEAPRQTQRTPTPNPSHAPETRTSRPSAPPVEERTANRSKSAAFVPARPVHVTEPERVTVQNLPRTPQPTESRFIPKQPPSHPAQEQSHVSGPKPASGHESDSRRK